MTQVIGKKCNNSLIVTGSAGIGKTHTVLSTLQSQGLQKDKDYFVFKSKMTPRGLFRTLFLHYDKIIVFDDLDDLFQDVGCYAILKACLDSYEVREVAWSSEQNGKKNVSVNAIKDSRKKKQMIEEARQALLEGEAGVKIPDCFEFKGHVIFISNLPQAKFDKAVLSRSKKIDLSLTDKQIFSRMKEVVTKLKDKKVADHAFKTLVKQYNSGELDLPNLRTVLNFTNTLKSGVKNAERLSKYC